MTYTLPPKTRLLTLANTTLFHAHVPLEERLKLVKELRRDISDYFAKERCWFCGELVDLTKESLFETLDRISGYNSTKICRRCVKTLSEVPET